MKHHAKYAGISIQQNGHGIKKYKFHITGAVNRPIGLWMELPGKAQFRFVKLPRTLSKINAARFLLKHKDFKQPNIQKFLRTQIERREAGLIINPRRPIRVLIRRQRARAA